MSYIAFLDLLGTKNLSTDDATSYSKSISIFTNCLQRSLVEGCEAYAFSDCAYLEASTLSQIVSTLYTFESCNITFIMDYNYILIIKLRKLKQCRKIILKLTSIH